MINTLQSSDASISESKSVFAPLYYYNKGSDLVINYVSDLHLESHLPKFNSVRSMLLSISRSLSSSLPEFTFRPNIIVFLGDIASSSQLTVQFYKTFVSTRRFIRYKKFKEENSVFFGLTLDEIQSRIDKRYNTLAVEYRTLLTDLNQYIDCKRLLRKYESKWDLNRYLESRYFQKRNLPSYLKFKLQRLWDLQYHLNRYRSDAIYQAFPELPHDVPLSLKFFNIREDKDVIISILGNHELFDFDNVDEGVSWYKGKLDALGVNLLHNECLESDTYIVYGGVGFAGYNDVFNATRIRSTTGFTREDELCETKFFESGYKKALDHAVQSSKCFICLSHYPVNSCIQKTDKEAIYFSGHTHRNSSLLTQDTLWIFDNQIGNRVESFLFKQYGTCVTPNPFISYEDGYYEITLTQYLQYQTYINERVFRYKLLTKALNKGQLYLFKNTGFYAFILRKENCGMYIVKGGMYTRITTSSDISELYNSFLAMCTYYVDSLYDFRIYQLKISEILKSNGFSGEIHGCIVDFDFYNHVMCDFSDGSLKFYYSPELGISTQFKSFSEMISFNIDRSSLPCWKDAYTKSNLISTLNSSLIVSDQSKAGTALNYSASRRMRSLQRLFDKHTLREFDLSLIDITLKGIKKRKTTFIGSLFMINHDTFLVIDDNLHEIVSLVNLSTHQTLKMSIFDLRKQDYSIFRLSKSLEETILLYPEHIDDVKRYIPLLGE